MGKEGQFFLRQHLFVLAHGLQHTNVFARPGAEFPAKWGTLGLLIRGRAAQFAEFFWTLLYLQDGSQFNRASLRRAIGPGFRGQVGRVFDWAL